MTRRRMSVALVALVLLGTPWADAGAQTTAAEVVATRQRAEEGDAFAQSRLGASYRTGQGVPQDFVEAHKWFNLAPSRTTGDDGGASQKDAAKARDIMAKLMTPRQLAEAQQRASEWQAAFDARQE